MMYFSLLIGIYFILFLEDGEGSGDGSGEGSGPSKHNRRRNK